MAAIDETVHAVSLRARDVPILGRLHDTLHDAHRESLCHP